ncbi:MAG: carbon storage regulator CsrA [Planctomycetota bacterium]
MLVLTRKQQEKIQIGDDIVITVLRTKGKTVRLGIEAPSAVPVLRGELAVRIREEQEQSESDTASPSAPEVNADTQASRNSSDRSTGRDSIDEPQVLLERVPRSRVATVLPRVLGEPAFAATASEGRGPLRSMLDRRAGVSL